MGMGDLQAGHVIDLHSDVTMIDLQAGRCWEDRRRILGQRWDGSTGIGWWGWDIYPS